MRKSKWFDSAEEVYVAIVAVLIVAEIIAEIIKHV